MRVLVTNDDGVKAPGLAYLARELVSCGYDVVVAAPMDEASGAGAAVGPVHTMGGGLAVERVEIPGAETQPAYAVEALPALIVLAACLGAFGEPPDLVAAGINPGRNVGRAALHSGTVGAALTSTHFGKRALAMSIQSGPFSEFESAGPGEIHFETAATLAGWLMPVVAGSAPLTVLSCNVPNLPLGRIEGIRTAPLGRSGLLQTAAINEEGTLMHLGVEIGRPEPGEETDVALTTLGYATVTALQGVGEDSRPEITAKLVSALGELGRSLGPAGGPSAQGRPA